MTILAFLMLPMHVNGAIYSYISRSEYSSSLSVYHYTVESWEDETSQANPCFGGSGCTLWIAHRHDESGNPGTTYNAKLDSNTAPEMTKVRTVGELGQIYKRYWSLPLSGTLEHTGSKVPNECVGIFYRVAVPPVGLAYAQLLPGSICGVAPPPAGVCGFTDLSDIVLDHGTINLDESSSSRVEKSIEVQCSVASNLKLVIATGEQGKLVLSGGEGAGFYSSLTLDGMYANDGVVLSNVGPAGRRVTLVSNLHAGTGSGVFTGSAVMILAIP